MITVLCEPFDLAARATLQGIRDRGIPANLYTSDDFAGATRVVHRVGPGDQASIEWTLADGREINGRNMGGVLNRLMAPPSAWLRGLVEQDREYAHQELFALFLSWLHSLSGPVLNRPSPLGLSGAWRHESEWAALAAQAGLATPPFRLGPEAPEGRWLEPKGGWQAGTAATAFVVGTEVVGAPSAPALEDECRRLAQLAETELLGVELADPGRGAWMFVGATPCPDLRLGGEPLLDALSAALNVE